jgi:Chromo (CHRromatin Organisation MOdifier) domain
MASDSDSDAISLTSTVLSEQKDEYPVETILAEKEVDGNHRRFLVMWEGYSDVRATWEPATSFDDESTFLEWEAKKRRQNQGLEPAFDLEDWQARVDAIERERLRRKARRKAKRKRLGIPTSPNEGEARAGDSGKAPSPSAKRSRRRSTHIGDDDDDESESSVGEFSKDKNDGKKRRHSDQTSDQSDHGLTSDDSLLEDIKVKQFNKKHKRLRKKIRVRETTSVRNQRPGPNQQANVGSASRPGYTTTAASGNSCPGQATESPSVCNRCGKASQRKGYC